MTCDLMTTLLLFGLSDSRHNSIASFCDSCFNDNSQLSVRLVMWLKIISGFQVVVYFGKDGRILDTPFIKRFASGYWPRGIPLIGVTNEESAERAVPNDEYPTPV